MMKKLLFTLLIVFVSFASFAQLTLETTSSSATWSPIAVGNTGLLSWTVTGDITDSAPNTNDPTFDMTGNSLSLMTITDNAGFAGLGNFRLPNLNISTINVNDATALTVLFLYNNQISSLDLSQNNALVRLQVHNNNISNLDLSNKPSLDEVDIRNNALTSTVLDQIVNDLDANGVSNGDLQISNQSTGQTITSAAQPAYNNLIAKGWTIDVPPPAFTAPEIDITGLGVSIPGDGSNTPSTTDDTDFGTTNTGTNISKTFTINNSGDADLILTDPSPFISITGTDAADFSVSLIPNTPITSLGSTTFEITFNTATAGVKTAILTIANNDADEGSYTFNIQAEATAASGPEIDVTGLNGVSIPSGNTPIAVDGTDFGQVEIGSSSAQTFTITNVGDSDLVINFFGTSTTNYFDFAPPFGGGITLTPGSSTTIEVTFTPLTAGVQTGQISINNTDTDEGTYVVNLAAEGITPIGDPEIQVFGAGDENTGVLIVNGDFTPDTNDDTDFGLIQNNTTKTNTYTIYNNGTASLDINSIAIILDAEFTLDNDPTPVTLLPGASATFNVIFSPTSTNSYSGLVQIDHSDATEGNPYQFSIAGESSDVVVNGDLMISQYYEGGGNNQWIEIKNISGGPLAAGQYFLCLYDDNLLPVLTQVPPAANVAIPAMVTDQVILFQNPAATLPNGNLGVTPEPSDGGVCSFNGDDVIIISTTNDGTSYGSRQDIIGDPDGNFWGQGTSFVRGGCASETPDAFFDPAQWIDLGSSAVVDNANVNSNIALGTQFIGSTTWNGTNWDNGIADQTRNVIIASPYTASNGTFEACGLTINANVNFDGGTQESIILYGDLTVNAPATLVVGDQESLVIYDPNAAISGVITKIESSTPLVDIHDTTYWSSSVTNANLGTVFAGVNPNRIFFLNGGATGPFAPPYDHWFVASGSMQVGRGYAAEGPATGVHTISFTGTPNNGNITIPVTYKGTDDIGIENDNFNLLGNPYPSAISLASFITNPAHTNFIEHTVYLWNHQTVNTNGEFSPADYASWTEGTGGTAATSGGPIPNGFLSSGQGFMIRTEGGTPNSVEFVNRDKVVGSNNQFFKQNNSKKQDVAKSDTDRVWLNLRTSDGGFSQILIGFFDDATDGIDKRFDGLKLKAGNPVTFYSTIENKKYVIQGLNSFNEDKSVELGFDTEVAKSFSIQLGDIEGTLKDTEIYLIDNLLGITHNLKESDYQFEQTEVGEFPNRFTLQFVNQALGVDDLESKNQFFVSNDLGNLKINSGKSAVKSIKVYDILGRMLIQEKPNKKSFYLNADHVKEGTVLIIEANLENGSRISKKTIKY